MTNEELQLEVKRLEEQIKALKLKLEEERFLPYVPYEVNVPDNLEDYFYIDETGCINSLYVYDEEEQIKVFKRGLAFKTKEEAEQFDKERILINRAKDWAKKYNEGWKPDWGDFSKYNHAVTYDYCEKLYVKSYCFVNFLSKLPYFKSHEIAEQFIEEFGDEIKEVLC